MRSKLSVSETYEMYEGKISKFKRLIPVQDQVSFSALDTESYEDGKILCFYTNNGGKSWKHDAKVSFFDLMHIIESDGNRIFFCWNMDYDVTVLLKTIGFDLKEFYDNDFNSWKYDKYVITYIKAKLCKIQNTITGITYVIYDIAQFYGRKKLDTIAKTYLNKTKKYDGKYQNKVFPKDLSYEDRLAIELYCELDARLTFDLVDLWIQTFYHNFGTYPDTFASPASLGYHVLQTRITPNLFADIPLPVQQLGAQCFFGGRFELFQRGKFENVWHYDINSAYPFAMLKIPDLTSGAWHKIDKYTLSDNSFGVAKIKVKVHDKYVCPFPFRLAKKGMVYYPRGTFTTFCTLHEIRSAIKHYNIDLLEINGYEHVGYQKSVLGGLVENMYYTRKQQSEEIQKYIYKVMINAIYGKLAQTKPWPSPLYNPVLASLITGYARSLLLDAMANVKDHCIHVATDSIFSTKEIPELKVSDQMGDWSGEKLKSMIQFSNGIYTFENDQNKKFTKTRGFVLRVEDETGQDKFLNLNDCKIKYNIKNDMFYIESKILKYKTLRRAIIEKNFEEIAKFKMEKKMIDLNSDRKRLWLAKIKNLDVQQRSIPLNVDWLK